MKKSTINYKELCELGFKEHQARDIIKLAKARMVQRGFGYYNNARLGVVPVDVVTEITGISFESEEESNVKN